MANYARLRIRTAYLVGVLIISSIVLGFAPRAATIALPQQTTPIFQVLERVPGPQIILQHKNSYNPHRVPPPEQAELGIQTATITVNYNPPSCPTSAISPWPNEAKAAFNAAIAIWEALLVSSQTIVVNACWRSDLGPLTLGSAGATDFYFASRDGLKSVYPVALVNTFEGRDVNDSDGFDADNDGSDADSEISANFSSTFDWYFGVDANPPFDKVDFMSVVLHEVGHGLGFLGFAGVNNGLGSIGVPDGISLVPAIYDRFTEDGNGTKLLNYTNPSASLGDALTGQVGGAFFNGPNANAGNGGSRVELYTPPIWFTGSSYSHLGESFNNTPNALMTFALENGEAAHNPGPVTLGIFQDMGWAVTAASGPDLTLTQQVIGLDHQPGDPVTFTLKIENIGGKIATNVVVTDDIPGDILTPTYTSDIAGISARVGTTYIWDLPDLAPSGSGTITVAGTIDPNLPDDFAIVNTATIETSDIETNTANNSGTVIVGGTRVYLPLILR